MEQSEKFLKKDCITSANDDIDNRSAIYCCNYLTHFIDFVIDELDKNKECLIKKARNTDNA